MPEDYPRRKTRGKIAAAVAAVAMLTACGNASASHTTTSKSFKGELPVEQVTGLAVGDKISLIHSFNPAINKTTVLRPNETQSPEDLCVILDPNESQIIMQHTNDTNKEDGVGVLVTNYSGGVSISFVTYDTQTQLVTGFSAGKEISKGLQLLYSVEPSNGKEAYSVFINTVENSHPQVDLFVIPTPNSLPSDSTI